MKKVLCLLLILSTIILPSTLNIVENEFIKMIIGPEGFDQGRFSIETTGGDPTRSNDDNLPLIYGRPKPWTSYTSIAIDSDTYGFGTQTVKRAGKSARYGQIIAMDKTDDGITAVSQMGDMKVTQTLQFFRNPLTNINDSVLIEYRLFNGSDTSRKVGVRVMMDTMLGKNDGAPFRIGNEAIVSEKEYVGADIMDFWQSFDSLTSPNVIAQGVLRYSPAGLTPPDRLILMNWGTLADEVFNVEVVPNRSFIREGEDEPDTALALLWRQEPLGPKKTRVYRTVMGLGGISLVPGDLSLGLSAPSHIAITDPNEYLIVAYISNTGGFTVNNAKALLELPSGVTMVKGESSTDLGKILPNGSRQMVYKIKLDPAEATEGTQSIILNIQSDTLADQELKRSITFTGQPRLELKAVGEPIIKRGMDQYVDVPVAVLNHSDVSVSDIEISMAESEVLSLPVFETKRKLIAQLEIAEARQVSWKLKVREWSQGEHLVTINIKSSYTKQESFQVPVTITLGQPKGRLYYSEPSYFMGNYGYIWMTLMDMPTFKGLDLKLTWDPAFLKPIRVSPEPWIIESIPDPMDHFYVTNNVMIIDNLSADDPPWRMIIGKWHFKVLESGDTNVKLWQGDQPIDSIQLTLREPEKLLKNEEEERDFDF